jgi:hypothetical protein
LDIAIINKEGEGITSPLTGTGSPRGTLSARERSKIITEEKRKKREYEKNSEKRRILNTKLPLKFTITTLEKEIVGKELMRDLSVYIPFLISFVFFFFAVRDVEQSYFSVASVKDTLVYKDVTGEVFDPSAASDAIGPKWKKQLKDVANTGDFHEWLEGVVIYNLWDRKNPNRSRSFAPTTGQNIAVGSLRIRQHKVHDKSCTVNQYFYSDSTARTCYGRLSDKNSLDKKVFGTGINFTYTDGCKYSGTAVVGEIERYPCGGFIQDIPFTVSFNDAMAFATNLRQGGFVNDNSVRFLIVEFYTYNPALDVFTANRIFMEITAGGGWLPSTKFRNFAVYTWSPGRVAYDFYFLAFVLYYWLKFFSEWKSSLYNKSSSEVETCCQVFSVGKCFKFLFSLWPFLEFVNLSSFLVVFIARWVWWQSSLEEDWALPFPDNYPESLDYVQNMFQIQVYFNSLNCVITFLKLLKFVRLNDRLNILTRTLEACTQNILGVLILFVLVIFAYSITGSTLFGGGLSDFRNIGTSFSTCMRIVIGNFDYPAMKAENRSVAFIYFWTFVVLANFVLLNFIIAVISEGFQQESEKTKAVPIDFVLARFAHSVRTTFSSFSSLCSTIFGAAVSRWNQLPEDIVLECLKIWREDELRALGISEEMIEHGIIAEPETLVFERTSFAKAVPLSHKDITDEILDSIWEDLVIAYELDNKVEEEELFSREVAMHRRVLMKSFTDVLLDRQEKEKSKGLNFVGGTSAASTDVAAGGSEVINNLFSNPRSHPYQNLEDRTIGIKEQMEQAKMLLNVLVHKAGTLQYVGASKS